MSSAPAPKLLQQEKIIRMGGVLMLASPVANFIITVASLPPSVQNRWSLLQLGRLASTIPATQFALWIVSFVVGGLMLKGRRTSWLSVIVFLGVFIVYNLMHLKSDMQSGALQPILSLATNLALFVLVYMQEFRQINELQAQEAAAQASMASGASATLDPVFGATVKSKPATAKKKKVSKAPPQKAPPKPNDPTVTGKSGSVGALPTLGTAGDTASNVMVDMRGHGPWADVVKVTESEILMRCRGEVPERIETEPVEIVIAGDLVMKLRFVKKQNLDYEFRYTDASPNDLVRFGEWLKDQSGKTLPKVRRSS